MHIHLIDGYGFIFRAYHSLPPLLSPNGIPVSAVYGFINMIVKLMSSHKPDMMAVALDSGVKNHRHRLFSGYKANRVTLPDDLIVQFPIVREALNALNIIAIEDGENEADDLIATYAVSAVRAGHEVTVVSSDKDLLQLLIYDGIQIYDPLKNKVIQDADIEQKFGVCAGQFRDALALIGDASDNIPGVRGVGPKTAAELLKKYTSLEGIYQHLDELKSERIKNLLLQYKDDAFLSQKLVTLKEDINVNLSFDEIKVKEINKKQLSTFAHKFGFKSLLKTFSISEEQMSSGSVHQDLPLKVILINELDAKFLDEIVRAGKVALHFFENKLFIATHEKNLCIEYVDEVVQNLFASDSTSAGLYDIMMRFQAIIESEKTLKVLFNAKIFIKFLKTKNIKIAAFDDIQLMSYVLSTNNQYKILSEMPLKSCDAYGMLCHHQSLKSSLAKNGVLSLYEKIEKSLIELLADVEIKGVLVSGEILKKINHNFSVNALYLQKAIYKIAGQNFNIGSTKQLAEVLFEHLKITAPTKKSSKSGHYSTGVDILEAISNQGHEIADLILQWRHLTKLINTYTHGLQKSIDPKTGRVHTTFEMSTTTTGRLSSHNPNLQNIPIRTEYGKKIRQAFIGPPGHVIISADYSQIELRLLAHIADIEPLKKAFLNNQDIHAVTASEIFNVPLHDIDEELRRKAKGINFGIIYGISPFGLAKNIGITQSEARHYIEQYFIKYPGIQEYMVKTIEFAKQHGFVETILKRRCFIEGINSGNYNIKSFAERAAINAPLQGSSSDIIKKAMVALPKDIARYLILQIHDELLFEVPEEISSGCVESITSIMEGAVSLSIPLQVDISVRKSWAK